ncbi:SGNH hydrolase-type esterase domain-containing protein [Artemisia annua]|uniref:SGNH hydrolase-type esterase domain-containing protein n=1 Tax=Artemisia annua TaxID=35608 RepID=A0A2U1N3R2_ARTAN|nr:SGNH hydrolase-type esterase domain-containing protein [Artemisia annua]
MSSLPIITIFMILAFGIVLGTESNKQDKPKRAFFVFGDSLVDNGNNNHLATTARADSPPYGIDYPSRRPTGRFWEHIGADPVLPFLDRELTGQKLLNGANFASAGIGILNDTGIQFVNIIRMPSQLRDFEEYQHRITSSVLRKRSGSLTRTSLGLDQCAKH